jgi:P pilus assembly chaperone PapD
VISVTDWDIKKDGSISFTPASDKPTSAIPWITYSPAAVSIASGRREIVRVTVTLPAGTPPGEYRAGFFIQERPPAAPPAAGERVVVFRFRQFVSLFVMVPPLGRKASFSNVSLEWAGNSLRLLCSMKNEGAIHVRPTITWSLRRESAEEIAGTKRFESTVLLPFSELNESFNLDPLPQGRYQVVASIDFHEGGPIQSITKTIEITAPPTQAPAPPGVN